MRTVGRMEREAEAAERAARLTRLRDAVDELLGALEDTVDIGEHFMSERDAERSVTALKYQVEHRCQPDGVA